MERVNPAARAAAMAPNRRALAAGASLLLGAAALLCFGLDVAERLRVERFVAAVGLEALRPLDVASLRLEPAADLVAAGAAEVAIQNPVTPAAGPEPWLGAAADLVLRALRRRPGWPLHAHVLAQVVYREGRGAGAAPDPRRWMAAWRVAARGAPGAEAIAWRRAQACLEAWPTLPAQLRPEAFEAIRAAMRDPDFFSQHLAPAAEVLGGESLIGLLPDRAEPLRAAAAVLASRSLDQTARLLERADRAEGRERAAAVQRLAELAKRGERAALAQACRAFAGAYPAVRFDDRSGRAQTAFVLELWPEEPGVWRTDPRAQLVRFFLDGRDDAVARGTLRRAVASLSEVPDPVRAAVLLSAGDRAAAESLRASKESAGHDWAAFDLRAARDALARGDAASARRALERLPSGEPEACEALLARRDTARALNEPVEVIALERRLAELRVESASSAGWSRGGRLEVCIDPSASERSLVVVLAATSPAIVAYGWDQSRTGTVLVSGERDLTVPLEGRTAGRTFWFAALVGGPVAPRNVATR